MGRKGSWSREELFFLLLAFFSIPDDARRDGLFVDDGDFRQFENQSFGRLLGVTAELDPGSGQDDFFDALEIFSVLAAELQVFRGGKIAGLGGYYGEIATLHFESKRCVHGGFSQFVDRRSSSPGYHQK